MSATTWLNTAAAVLAVAAAAAIGANGATAGDPRGPATVDASGANGATLGGAITDSGGHVTRVRAFQRILSGSSVTDRLLLELCEPDRVIAFTAYGAEHSPFAHQYAGKITTVTAGDVERIVALKPDLYLTTSFGDPGKLARLREAGVEVFDLGDTRGVESLLASARTVAALIGHPERGERFAKNFARRFDHIAARIAPAERRRAIYLALYADQFFGGAAGTSYHDVLTHAGLVDAAAERYSNWPQYSTEQVVALDPEVIVTKPGMRATLCGRAVLSTLKACRPGGVIVEVANDLLDDPGPSMQEAAETVFAAVYGDQR